MHINAYMHVEMHVYYVHKRIHHSSITSAPRMYAKIWLRADGSSCWAAINVCWQVGMYEGLSRWATLNVCAYTYMCACMHACAYRRLSMCIC